MGKTPIWAVGLKKTRVRTNGKTVVRPVEAIHARCVDDCAGTATAVKRCPFDGTRDDLCALHKFRGGTYAHEGRRYGSRFQAIRRYCLWCCCGQAKEVELCASVGCALWPHRFGMRSETAEKRGKCVTVADFYREESDEQEAK